MTDFAKSLNDAVRLHQAGRLADARQRYDALLRQQPNQPDLLHLIGLTEHQGGNYQAAVDWITRAIQQQPAACVYHANLAEAYRALDQFDPAIRHLNEALQLDNSFAPAWNSLGIIRRRQGRWDEAVSLLERALEHNPSLADAQINLGLVLRDLGRHEEALLHARRGVELNPRSAAAHNNLANILKDLGRIEGALEHYRQAIDLDPSYGQAYSNWAQSRRFSEDDRPVIDRMQHVLSNSKLTKDSRSHLHFALGKALDDCQQWDEAFAHYQQANALVDVQFDHVAFERYIAAIRSTYTRQLFAEKNSCGVTDSSPIFIIGMPRSGTSLVEQILASHSDVVGVGERKEIALATGALSKTLGTALPYPDCAALLNTDTSRRLADEYLSAMQPLCQGASRFVDKMMTNYLHVGFITLLFPDAAIVHCQRHPLDVCLSCYFQDFSHRPAETFDLHDLGLYYRRYVELIDHWHDVLPVKILDVSYEQLIEDQEKVTRDFLAYCGLPWDDRCLDFHRTSRVVQTASGWQVRQPLSTKSVHRWRNYQAHLQPLREALGDVLKTCDS